MRHLLLPSLVLLLACGTSPAPPAESATDSASAQDAADALDASADVTASSPSLVQLLLHADSGTVEVFREKRRLFAGATADVKAHDAAGPFTISLHTCQKQQIDATTLRCQEHGLMVTWHVQANPGVASLRAQVTVTREAAATGVLTLDKLTPLVVDVADGGSIEVGSDPKDIRVLQNGGAVVADPTAILSHGDDARSFLVDTLGLDVRGQVISDWNVTIADPKKPANSWVAGFLTFEKSIPTLGVGMAEDAQADANGIRPFAVFAAENLLVFAGRPLAPGETLSSDPLWLEPFPEDPLAALERYADAVAAEQGIVPWPKRGAGYGAPIGWNSWSGGDSTGGHGHAIDEALILDALATYKREFQTFGANFFQIDDGWQEHYGDWKWRTDRFPHGGAWMAKQIKDAGFKPGLWVGPFSLDKSSAFVKAHPDWIEAPATGLLATVGGNKTNIDTSNPEVHAWLASVGAELKAQGWEWIKTDYSYWALFGTIVANPNWTTIEAWRTAWKAWRNSLGNDIFVCGIGATGAVIGLVEGFRLTGDNGPRWENGDPDDPLSTPRSFSATVRTGSRRWFYQNRVWVNHDDLIFFRQWPDPTVKPLTFGESRAFSTWIGLMGSVVKIGDKMNELAQHGDWIDVLRRLMPIWPDGARPLDVLTRDLPEQFAQEIHAPAGDWQNLGLCNWGHNRDHAQPKPVDMPDGQTRTFTVQCPHGQPCAAYEFWSETYLGEHTQPFQIDVPPHDCKVLALRPLLAQPQLVGDNRHVTQGAADLGPVVWDPQQKTLSTTTLAAVGTAMAPWTYHLAFRVPPGLECAAATVEGVQSPLVVQQNGLVDLRFAFPPAMAGKSAGIRLNCVGK